MGAVRGVVVLFLCLYFTVSAVVLGDETVVDFVGSSDDPQNYSEANGIYEGIPSEEENSATLEAKVGESLEEDDGRDVELKEGDEKDGELKEEGDEKDVELKEEDDENDVESKEEGDEKDMELKKEGDEKDVELMEGDENDVESKEVEDEDEQDDVEPETNYTKEDQGMNDDTMRMQLLEKYHLDNCTQSGGQVAKISSIKYCYINNEVQFCMCPLDVFITLGLKSIFMVTSEQYEPFFTEDVCLYPRRENVIVDSNSHENEISEFREIIK